MGKIHDGFGRMRLLAGNDGWLTFDIYRLGNVKRPQRFSFGFIRTTQDDDDDDDGDVE